MRRPDNVFSRVSSLDNEARAMMDRLHTRPMPGGKWIREALFRARRSAYGARFGDAFNYPRLLQAEQELEDAVLKCKAFNDMLWGDA